MRSSSHHGQIVTEKPDELTNPLQQNPLQAPDELLAPAVVNMHVEERQGRKISWIMDDLTRDIAKLRVIFVERLTEGDKSTVSLRSKTLPEKSYEILKNLSSISDWLADANIDGESYTLPITEEEMKIAHDKPAGRKQFIEEQTAKMNAILDECLEKTRKITRFIITRQGIFDKFVEYLGGKTSSRPPPPEHKMETGSLLANLTKAGLASTPEIEKIVNEFDEAFKSQTNTIAELKLKQTERVSFQPKAETATSSSKLAEMEKLIDSILVDLENFVKDQNMDDEVKEAIVAELAESQRKMTEFARRLPAAAASINLKSSAREIAKKEVETKSKGGKKGKRD